jgi:hypothetical protein
LRDAVATVDGGSGGSKAKCALSYAITTASANEGRLQLTHPISGVVFEFTSREPAKTTSTSS